MFNLIFCKPELVEKIISFKLLMEQLRDEKIICDWLFPVIIYASKHKHESIFDMFILFAFSCLMKPCFCQLYKIDVF